MKYLRRQLFEAWMFFVVPGVAALLPWRLAWRWLKRWAARAGGPFDEAAQRAVAVAPHYLAIGDESTFVERVRLVWLLDYCDLFLSMLHRLGWNAWFFDVRGAWPAKGPFIAAGFHHGNCYWLFRTLRRAGHKAMVVSVRWDRDDYKGLPMRYWYGRLRYWDMQRMGRQPIAFRPGIKQKLTDAMRSGSSVLNLIDLPPRLAPRGRRPVRLLDRDVNFPDGIVTLARELRVPLVPYWMEYDERMFTRRFHIGEPIDPDDVDGALQKLADILDRQIRRNPQAWFFWPEWPQWIADAEAAARANDAEVHAGHGG